MEAGAIRPSVDSIRVPTEKTYQTMSMNSPFRTLAYRRQPQNRQKPRVRLQHNGVSEQVFCHDQTASIGREGHGRSREQGKQESRYKSTRMILSGSELDLPDCLPFLQPAITQKRASSRLFAAGARPGQAHPQCFEAHSNPQRALPAGLH